MKKLLVMLMVGMLSCGMLLTGCGGSEEEQEPTVEAGADVEEEEEEAGAVEEVVNDVATAIQADGREYGQTYTLAQTDVMTTAFFQMQINSVETCDELEGYVPNDGYTFMVVNVSITNTFGSEIPMFDADFALLWAEDEGAYPDTDFVDALPAEYYIADGETTTGNLVYIVPKGQTNFILEYYDLWDDDFEGNTYDMRIKL